MPSQSHFPLCSEIFRLYSKIPCSPGEPILRKSAKAIGEITLKMQVETWSQNLVPHPRISFSTGGKTFCWYLGDFPAEQSFPYIFIFQKSWVLPQDLPQEECCYPQKPQIWKGRLRNRLLGKGTPRNSSAAFIIIRFMCLPMIRIIYTVASVIKTKTDPMWTQCLVFL